MKRIGRSEVRLSSRFFGGGVVIASLIYAVMLLAYPSPSAAFLAGVAQAQPKEPLLSIDPLPFADEGFGDLAQVTDCLVGVALVGHLHR